MQTSCLLVPVLYLSTLVSFECDSKERPELYPLYFWQTCAIVVWGSVGLSIGLWLLATLTDPGKLRVDSSEQETRLCTQCNLMRDERTHHCSKCKRCVEDMDHHCSYLNNCVGRRNRKYFVQFLTATCPGSLLYLFLLAHYSFGHISAAPIPSQLSAFLPRLLFLLISLVQVLLILLILTLAATQHFLIFHNMTTLELLKEIKRSPPRWCWEWQAEYDAGLIPNYRKVFGTSLSEWCLPTPPHLVPSAMLPIP